MPVLQRSFVQERLKVERTGVQGEFAGGGAGPLVLREVPIQFHAVLVRIAEVQCMADAVVGGAVEGEGVCQQAASGRVS